MSPMAAHPKQPTTEAAATQADAPVLSPVESDFSGAVEFGRARALLAGLLAVAFGWAYWPVFGRLIESWDKEPDYSHGYLVIPVALYILWFRRDSRPSISSAVCWGGLLLIAASMALRIVGSQLYIESVGDWSLPIWIGGAVWLLAGRQFFFWALPAIGFLYFMIPLPYRIETALSLPLQLVATQLSCWMLQFLGQPAVAEGHSIWLNEYRLDVAQTCSGLRMFVGIAALAYAYTVLVCRGRWQKVFVLLSLIPVALLANAIRITATGLLYQWVDSDAAKTFSHDVSGWIMIPLAAALFAVAIWYINRLFIETKPVDARELLQRGATR